MLGEELREAACNGDLNKVTRLFKDGADINSQNAVNGW